MKKFTAIFTLAVILALPLSSEAKQLLVNGDFEKGWDNWTFMYNQQNWSPLDLSGGKKAIRCWWDGGVKQVVPVVPGKAYKLKADVFVPTGGDKEGWTCWISLSWYVAGNNRLGTAWNISAQDGKRGDWVTYNSGVQIAPRTAAFACVDFGIYQNGAKPANPIDFDNFSLEEIE